MVFSPYATHRNPKYWPEPERFPFTPDASYYDNSSMSALRTEVRRVSTSVLVEWLHDLRDVLWNKYQRRRVPHEQVARLDVLIEEAEARGDR